MSRTPHSTDVATRVTRPAIPGWVAMLVLAFGLALFHMAPYLHAAASAQGEWSFTGNLTISPDHMQYRVWMRQSQVEGPVISNWFTTEPNRPHLPVFFFWGIGKVALWTGLTPEAAYAWGGAVLAAALGVVVVVTVRAFLPAAGQLWAVVIALFASGGLGGHLKVLAQVPPVAASGAFQRFIAEPLERFPVFEDYRSHYLVKVLLDTHSIVLWIVGLVAILALLRAVERPGWRWSLLAASAFAAMTVMHVYEGITLLAVAAGVVLCCWTRVPAPRPLLGVLAWCGVSVATCYGLLGALYARGGLPLPTWNAIPMLPLIVLLAYPVAIALIAWRGRALWESATMRERFLFGWALGCLVVTFAAPIFPYPDRGTLTLQVPLFVLAARIYFARWPRIAPRHLVLMAVVSGATPVWLAARTWHFSGFRSDAPFQFVNAGHRATIAALGQTARPDDVLLADTPDLLWMAPEFPGRLYVGHFFLTVDFTTKIAGLRDALARPEQMRPLLERSGATLLFVNASREPQRFADVPGLDVVAREPVGWLFRVRRAMAAPGGAVP